MKEERFEDDNNNHYQTKTCNNNLNKSCSRVIIRRDAIDKIMFGMLSPDRIRRQAEYRVTTAALYVRRQPAVNGIFDLRAGSIDRSLLCQTCGEGLKDCPGHWSYIEFVIPVPHPSFLKIILKILRAICYYDSRLLIKPTNAKFAAGMMMQGERALSYFSKLGKDRGFCDCLPKKKKGHLIVDDFIAQVVSFAETATREPDFQAELVEDNYDDDTLLAGDEYLRDMDIELEEGAENLCCNEEKEEGKEEGEDDDVSDDDLDIDEELADRGFCATPTKKKNGENENKRQKKKNQNKKKKKKKRILIVEAHTNLHMRSKVLRSLRFGTMCQWSIDHPKPKKS